MFSYNQYQAAIKPKRWLSSFQQKMLVFIIFRLITMVRLWADYEMETLSYVLFEWMNVYFWCQNISVRVPTLKQHFFIPYFDIYYFLHLTTEVKIEALKVLKNWLKTVHIYIKNHLIK